jgi:hypothetical protein
MFLESREIVFRHKIPVKQTDKFWKGLEAGRILKTVCRNCKREFYPPRAECICGGEVEWIEINEEGMIETFTVVYTIPHGFEWSKPYTIAIARFGKVKLMGWVENTEKLKVGDRVRAYTDTDKSGVWKVYFEVLDSR